MDTHLGVKYACEICKKEYSKQWSLKQHMYTHSDKKPFQCDFCRMEFIRKDKYDVAGRFHSAMHVFKRLKLTCRYKNHIKSVHDTEVPSSATMNLNEPDAV